MSVDSKPFKIRGHQGDYNSFIKDRPILVIDDEVDNGSVDTGEQKLDEKGEFDPEYDPKTINSRIRQILNAILKVEKIKEKQRQCLIFKLLACPDEIDARPSRTSKPISQFVFSQLFFNLVKF